MARPRQASTTKLVVTKWSRYSEAEVDGLRLLAARRRLSVAKLIRALTLEGLQRASVRGPASRSRAAVLAIRVGPSERTYDGANTLQPQQTERRSTCHLRS
jgi:hypothetical protein